VEQPCLQRDHRDDQFRALPKVALSSPPIASPVRDAICSVAWTIRLAMGTMARLAAKKIHVCVCGQACSRMTATGINKSSQLIVTSGLLRIASVTGCYFFD